MASYLLKYLIQFATSRESTYAVERKQLILSTEDGGSSTLKYFLAVVNAAPDTDTENRSPFNDAVTRSSVWDPLYDGRAIVGRIHEAYLSGTSLEDCQDRHEADVKAGVSLPQACTWAYE